MSGCAPPCPSSRREFRPRTRNARTGYGALVIWRPRRALRRFPGGVSRSSSAQRLGTGSRDIGQADQCPHPAVGDGSSPSTRRAFWDTARCARATSKSPNRSCSDLSIGRVAPGDSRRHASTLHRAYERGGIVCTESGLNDDGCGECGVDPAEMAIDIHHRDAGETVAPEIAPPRQTN
jgi:hypothetical protein